ncbi:hypothetical protein MTO96_025703 [Rhipicephalus appendiculatus]
MRSSASEGRKGRCEWEARLRIPRMRARLVRPGVVHCSRTARSSRARLCFSGFRGLEITSDNSDPCRAQPSSVLSARRRQSTERPRRHIQPRGTQLSRRNEDSTTRVHRVLYNRSYGGSELPPVCPQECQCRDNFTVVACSHRQLQRFPTPLPRSTQELDVSYNSIENVPTLVVARLTKATFCHNHVRTIPRGTFAHATALRTLDFSHNCLISLAADDLDGLEMLTDLDLSWNELRKLERYAFHKVPNLRTLKLSGNPLKFVDSSWFKNMDILEMVELRSIDAYSLAADAFVLAPRLHTIDLSENDFTDVPKGLESARNLRFLTMDQNPMVKLSKDVPIGREKPRGASSESDATARKR